MIQVSLDTLRHVLLSGLTYRSARSTGVRTVIPEREAVKPLTCIVYGRLAICARWQARQYAWGPYLPVRMPTLSPLQF